MQDKTVELKNALNEIIQAAEITKIEDKVEKALKILNEIEAEHPLADVLSDERKSLNNIGDSIFNLRMQINSFEDILIGD